MQINFIKELIDLAFEKLKRPSVRKSKENNSLVSFLEKQEMYLRKEMRMLEDNLNDLNKFR